MIDVDCCMRLNSVDVYFQKRFDNRPQTQTKDAVHVIEQCKHFEKKCNGHTQLFDAIRYYYVLAWL